MVAAGTRCDVTAVVREDWVRGERVRYDNAGRPISSVVVTRDEGTDVVVYAAAARGTGVANP